MKKVNEYINRIDDYIGKFKDKVNTYFSTVTEIAKRNELFPTNVANVYFRYNYRNHKRGDSTLDERVFRVTERYFDIKKANKLAELKEECLVADKKH